VIRHRMPLRSKLSPLPFGRSIGWVFGRLLSSAVERVGCGVQASNDPRQLKRPLLDFPRSQVVWLFKLTVNPLLNSAGRHAHEIRLRLADRNGIADLELPFPQPRLYLGKAEFNTPAVHVQTLRLACNQAIQRRRKGVFKTEQVSSLFFSRNDPPHHRRQRLSYD